MLLRGSGESEFNVRRKMRQMEDERTWNDSTSCGRTIAPSKVLFATSTLSTTSGHSVVEHLDRYRRRVRTRVTLFRNDTENCPAMHTDGNGSWRSRARSNLRLRHDRLPSPSNGAAAGSRSTLPAWPSPWRVPESWAHGTHTTCWRIPRGSTERGRNHPHVPSSQPVRGNIRHGFVYERVPHITLKSIANNAEIDVIWDKWQETLEPCASR